MHKKGNDLYMFSKMSHFYCDDHEALKICLNIWNFNLYRFFYIEIIYTYHKLYHCNYFPVYSVVALCAITSLGKYQHHLSSELFSFYKTKTVHPHFPSPSHGSYHPIFCLYEFHYSRYFLQRRRWHPLQYSCLENPMDRPAWWAAVHGITKSWTQLSDFTFTFHFHALEKEMATHSSVLAWRIPGTGEPGGLLSMGLHRVGHN